AITEVWGELAQDAEARAIVLTGAGRAFSAGGDFGLLQTMADDLDVRTATIDEGKTLVRSMLAVEVPIVGAVNGPAVGLGCSLAQPPPQAVVETKRLLNATLRSAVEALIDDGMDAEWRSFDTPEFRTNLVKLRPGESRGGDR